MQDLHLVQCLSPGIGNCKSADKTDAPFFFSQKADDCDQIVIVPKASQTQSSGA